MAEDGKGRREQAPKWFTRAVVTPHTSGHIVVEGCRVHYLKWECTGERVHGKQPQALLLAHGNRAHARWFAFIAPLLRADFEVYAIDNSGQGDSGWREEYTLRGWAGELRALSLQLGLATNRLGRPVLVGHSQGGYVVAEAVRLWPDEFAGAIVADSAVRPRGFFAAFDPSKPPPWAVDKPLPVYPRDVQPTNRFRLMPPQDCDNAFVVDFIAKHSAKQVDDQGSWTWKFDPRLDAKFNLLAEALMDKGVPEFVLSVPARLGWIVGEHSLVCNKQVVNFMKATMGKHIPIVVIPGARHHVLLDQPIAFAVAVQGMLAEWRRSETVLPTNHHVPRIAPHVSLRDPKVDIATLRAGLRSGL